MKKYAPLENHLENKKVSIVPMSFSDIESVIGDSLPPSARKHRAWWSNNPSNSASTYAWLAAGYKTTNVDLESETVVFRKQDAVQTAAAASPRNNGPHPLFGCMKGLIVIPSDLDLTQPADPEWGKRTYGTQD